MKTQPLHTRRVLRMSGISLILLFALYGSWIPTLLVATAMMLALEAYEALLGGILLDALYVTSSGGFFQGDFFYTTILLTVLLLSVFFGGRFRTLHVSQ